MVGSTPLRSVRILLTIAITLGVMSFGTGTAHGCSCAPLNPWNAFIEADAAIIGRIVDADSSFFGLGQVSTITFAVERELKGSVGPGFEMEVSDGSSCGTGGGGTGSRGAWFLYRANAGGWTTSECSALSPALMLRATRPLAEPDGRGPIRYIVGGDLGPTRLFALDQRGRILAYGEAAEGATVALDTCPGGRRFIESAAVGRIGAANVRDVASLRVTRSFHLMEAKFPGIYDVACLDEKGTSFLAVWEDGREWKLAAVRDGRVRSSFEGRVREAFIDGQQTFIVRGRQLMEVEATTGRLGVVAKAPPHADGVRLSPEGTWIAGVVFGNNLPGEPPSYLIVAAADGGRERRIELGSSTDGGRVQWRGDGTLVFLALAEERSGILTLDPPTLRRIGYVPGWPAGSFDRIGDHLVGLEFPGIVTTTLPNGKLRTIPTPDSFEGMEPYEILSVTGRVQADPQPLAPPTMFRSRTFPPWEPPGISPVAWVSLVLVCSVAVLLVASSRRRRTRRSLLNEANAR